MQPGLGLFAPESCVMRAGTPEAAVASLVCGVVSSGPEEVFRYGIIAA